MSKKTVFAAATISSIITLFGIITIAFLANPENMDSIFSPNSKKLFENHRDSVSTMCYAISPKENLGTCNLMDAIDVAFETTFPKLDSNNTFDSIHCKTVNDNLGLLYESIYALNNQDLTHMSTEQFRAHLTELVIQTYNLHENSYDVIYDFVKSTDELYLFWEQAWLDSC